ncbi:APC family permease [Amycolatopsis rhabdoformis]|uniref:APC family permease n=1 Tax=Amycolatopsis rhabdoformis TaxID=1448059 RepID=A0ABZ1ILM5_9PSEU|nr:APC family permease [Amycolatopsis rhabdoformis]WSE34489.1 APC family permease [Amycolatopsis rhabdoformis]
MTGKPQSPQALTAAELRTELADGGEYADKGLRSGALGMAASLILAVASAAPAYSLAATLAFIVGYVGFQAPAVVLVAFVPILFVSFGYAALNRRDPDCGTIFTWASRVLSPSLGFLGGWAIIASFVLVVGSLAQVAGQYVFLLFGADGIGSDPADPRVLLAGLGWLALMTLICYRGIEIAAAVQRALLFLEFGMLLVLSVVALVRVYTGSAPEGMQRPRLSWLNPFEGASPSAFVSGVVLMLFIYWGWETAITVNEETADRRRTPGRSATYSTLLLLAVYLLATFAAVSFAGIGDTGIGLMNPDNSGDVFYAFGTAVFGAGGFGSVLWHLLILMVLTSAAASTETTVLTLSRTVLSMADQGALPRALARVHPRFRIPHVGTIAVGVVGAVVYVALNFLGHGLVIGDAVSACGVMIAFYYGLTGLTSAWAHRTQWRASATDLWLRTVLPAIGGIVLLAAGAWSLVHAWDPASSGTSWSFGGTQVGGTFVIGTGSLVLGVVVLLICRRVYPAFFRVRAAR